MLKCACCQKEYQSSQLIWAPCGHKLCGECTANLLQRTLTNEPQAPPQGEWPEDERIPPVTFVGPFLPDDLVAQNDQRLTQLASRDNLYCYRPSCSTLIPPTQIRNNIGVCARCGAEVCYICKARRHARLCKSDEKPSQATRLAEQTGQGRSGFDICMAEHREDRRTIGKD